MKGVLALSFTLILFVDVNDEWHSASQAWVQTAWKKCLEKDAETAFVSVWKDAGYRRILLL